MSKFALRGGVTGVVLFATLATSASATPALIRPQGLVDVSGNGQYVLLSDGTVIDRTTSTAVMPQATLSSVDLANTAPIALGSGPSGNLYLRTIDKPQGTLVNIGPFGASVPAGPAKLVKNGTVLIFSTTESPSRILRRDLTTGVTTELVRRASLLDASEDGRVVTYARYAAGASRPAGSTAYPSDPSAALGGTAVGYQVDGGAQHLVAVPTFNERPAGAADGTCPTDVEVDWTRPQSLTVSQNGSQGGSYSLVLNESGSRGGGYPFSSTAYTRLTQTGSVTLAASDGQQAQVWVTPDPVSGAYGSILLSPNVSNPLANRAAVFASGGTRADLSIPLPPGSSDNLARYVNVIPFNAGAGAAYTAVPRATNAGGAYVDDALSASTEDLTPWTTLPRAADAIDDGSQTVTGTWYSCAPTPPAPVPGAFRDYAVFTPKTTGNSAGSVALTTAPAGKVKLDTARVSLSWGGIPLWTRATTSGQTINLPAIVPGLSGFKAVVALKLADGNRLTETYALKRTR